VVLGLVLGGLHASQASAAHTAAAGGSATAPGAATGAQVHPTTALGDVSSFAAIAKDVQDKVAKNDLTGANTRVKDLEVAWDSAEAGLKPRDPSHWHQLDGDIDGVLTSLRGSNPAQADCAAKLSTLTTDLDTFDGV
jgi:hypothetical protein